MMSTSHRPKGVTMRPSTTTVRYPCSACGALTNVIELSQGHKMCPECFRNYEQ